ncbi:hypothetical protein HAX54_031290 [Datura stramonium]|uniref:Uncharacterized protein n=1 Tax=Datura stramonium TaxID=4076 RepID=A0ABS8VBU0_DATST|nr:hypothetical protein [Datura stramonium]
MGGDGGISWGMDMGGVGVVVGVAVEGEVVIDGKYYGWLGYGDMVLKKLMTGCGFQGVLVEAKRKQRGKARNRDSVLVSAITERDHTRHYSLGMPPVFPEVLKPKNGSDDVPSPVPSSGLTTMSGIVPPEFFSSFLGSEGTFKEFVSKIVPLFGVVALTWLVEDGTRTISSSSSFSYKSVSTKMLDSSKIT